MKTRILRSFLAAVLLIGCDPGIFVRGLVKTVPTASSSGAPYATEAPLEDASVRMLCGQSKSTIFLKRTGANGEYDFHSLGALWDNCEIRVDKDGYHSQVIPFRSVCGHPGWGKGESCFDLVVNAELAPVAASPTAPSTSPSAQVALSAQIQPLPQPPQQRPITPVGSATGEIRYPVSFDLDTNKVLFLARHREDRVVALQAVCSLPCRALLAAGIYDVATSYNLTESPVASSRIEVSGPSHVSVTRTDKPRPEWIDRSFFYGSVTGLGLGSWALNMDSDNTYRSPMLFGGIGLLAGALLLEVFTAHPMKWVTTVTAEPSVVDSP